MERAGQIIFIHGASSSGKSTLARVLQGRIELPFWHISIDHLRDSGVLPTSRFRSGEFEWRKARPAFFKGFHASLAAYAEAGNNLIIEHILDQPDWQGELADLLAPYDLFFVALHCPLEELRARELARGDRPAGSAEADFHSIHRNRLYDLELHTADGTERNVENLLAAWRNPRGRSCFFKASRG
jgi:chloramphenicol 3-O phosphotransferase